MRSMETGKSYPGILRTAAAAAVVLGTLAVPMPATADHCGFGIGTREPPDALRLELIVPTTTVVRGQPVPIILEVENTGTEPIQGLTPTPNFRYRLWMQESSGHFVHRQDNIRSYLDSLAVTGTDTLYPGERRTYVEIWLQDTCDPIPDGFAEPGVYTIGFSWWLTYASETVDVTIVEPT